MRFFLYCAAFFSIFLSAVLPYHVNTQQVRKKIQLRTNAFITSDARLKHINRFDYNEERNSSDVDIANMKSDFIDDLILFKNTSYDNNLRTLPTLIRKKRFWRFWRKKDPLTTTMTTTTTTTSKPPIPEASEKKGIASWFSQAASKVKEAVVKGASDVKQGFKTLGRKIKKHFTKSDDNFHVFVNKVKEQVNQGDKDALDLLNKLGIDVNYNKDGKPVGSIVSKDAGNVTDILIKEGYYNPENITTFIQPDKAVIVFPSNTVTRQPPLVTKKILSTTKLPIFKTTVSVIDAKRTPVSQTTLKTFYSVTTSAAVVQNHTDSFAGIVSSETSFSRMKNTSENVATFYKTELPTSLIFPSLLTGSTDDSDPYEILAQTSTKVPEVNLSSSALESHTIPVTKEILLSLLPIAIKTTVASIPTSTPTSPPNKSIFTTTLPNTTTTTPLTTTTTTPTTTSTTTTTTTTAATTPSATTAIPPTAIPTTTTSTTTTPTTITSTTTTPTTTTSTTTTPTTTTTTPTTTTTTLTTTTTIPITTTTTPTTPTTIPTTTTTTTAVTTTTPTTTTTTTTPITKTTPTTTTPATTTTTPTKTTTSTTRRTTTNTRKKTTTTEAPFPPPFPDIFKDSAVRDRLHELFLNGDFNHDDLKSSFNFDPSKYDDYEY